MFILLLFPILGVHFMIFPSQTEQYIGLKEFVFEDKSRIFEEKLRILEVAVWYPTAQKNPTHKIDMGIWKIKDVVRDATLISGKQFPLIIFSHGYSGSQWTNTWFAEQMVQHGYIVAMVRHYGNNYGAMIPEICARPWNRPQDMSLILDRLLEDTDLQNNIDINRIAGAGFSQGGIACIWLAGAQAHLTSENLKQQITMVTDSEYKEIHFKDIPQKRLDSILDLFTEQDFKDANKSYYDSRFKAFFIMAPGIDEKNIMFTQEGLALANTPLHIVVGESDKEAIEQSQFFDRYIPNCSLRIIHGKVSHMIFLNEGTEEGKIKYPEYTLDHDSIDRAAIHKKVIQQAVEFFENALKVKK